MWYYSETARELYQYVPNVPDKPYRSIGRKSHEKKLLRLTSGHCNLRSHMHKLRLTESPVCECLLDRETPEHIMLHCSRYDSERDTLINRIEKIYISHGTPLHERTLTFYTLMNPLHKSSETRTAVSKAVLDFISSTRLSC